MFRCVVGVFGLPREVTELREVEIELEDGARLRDIIAALRREIPALEGDIICAGEDRLTDNYAFNINGRFYQDENELQVRPGDRVALLLLASGG
ncbi:MAG: MoaD/ThiS family protein [Dehalococcoidales bacterium]|nr:MAG: MoaD/ThiS family protein [Dehalococcoidales bacterium]